MLNRSSVLIILGLGFLSLSGCASNKMPGHVPPDYFTGTVFDRNAIGVRQTTEYLEVSFSPGDNGIRQEDVSKIKSFLAAYKTSGHGPLVMSVPERSEAPQQAISVAVEARQLAWEAGVEYAQIAGATYNADGRSKAPLVLAFKAFKAMAPDCPQMSEVDFSNITSNNDLPSLGCAIRTNLAAMIADPADLFGTRPMDALDVNRRSFQLEAWREGEATAAKRDQSEESSVSEAIE